MGRGGSERTSTEQQIFGRAALNRLDRGATDLVSQPGEYDADEASIAAQQRRREELEEQALAEIRLTDSGERGQPVS